MTPSYNIPGRHKGKEGFFLIRSYLLKKKPYQIKTQRKNISSGAMKQPFVASLPLAISIK